MRVMQTTASRLAFGGQGPVEAGVGESQHGCSGNRGPGVVLSVVFSGGSRQNNGLPTLRCMFTLQFCIPARASSAKERKLRMLL